eukprot:823258_1
MHVTVTLAISVYFLVQHVKCQCQRILPIRQHASCQDAITDRISVTETHYYQLSINDTYDINFESCNSEIDITLVVEDVDGIDLSDSYCYEGNACGSCNKRHNYMAENFTIPAMASGIYFIKIGWSLARADSGTYRFQINCIGSTDNISRNNTHLTDHDAVPYSTTSVDADFHRTDDCDYFSDNNYSVSDSQRISSLVIKDDSITVSFDIKLNEYCNSALCNIFYITTADCVESLSLSINGIENYFEISIVTEYDYHDIYRIPDANISLPTDEQYHAVYLLFMYPSGDQDHTHNPNLFKIDNFTHHYYSTSLTPSNTRYQLYMSNPWDDPTSADVSNICIHSLKYNNDHCDLCDGEIQCGETQTSALYPVLNPLHSNYLYFNLSKEINGSYVMFDSCGSYLYLYDISFNMLYQGDDGGNVHCAKGHLIVPLYDGEYILSITGSYSNYFPLMYSIRILCFDGYHDTKNYPYSMAYDIWSTSEWWEIESICEQTFGTSLATIIQKKMLWMHWIWCGCMTQLHKIFPCG